MLDKDFEKALISRERPTPGRRSTGIVPIQPGGAITPQQYPDFWSHIYTQTRLVGLPSMPIN